MGVHRRWSLLTSCDTLVAIRVMLNTIVTIQVQMVLVVAKRRCKLVGYRLSALIMTRVDFVIVHKRTELLKVLFKERVAGVGTLTLDSFKLTH
jgi:hypothetical protein